VTDENDPYFLYVLDVGEQDFHHLKRDQSLLVEFLVFPSKLIELIELCLNSNANSPSNTNTGNADSLSNTSNSQSLLEYNSSIFTANLEMAGGALTIVESNKFKQLTHISLQLRLGNDAAIKGYLSSRLTFITTVANKRKVELAATQTELKDEKQQRTELSKALEELRYTLCAAVSKSNSLRICVYFETVWEFFQNHFFHRTNFFS
jgi:spindle assembly abnormal protein 6